MVIDSRTDEQTSVNRIRYKIGGKIDKKVIIVAKNNAYDMLYQKLETKEGEKDIFKLARVRERKPKDLGNIRCIKDNNHKVLVNEAKIKERW